MTGASAEGRTTGGAVSGAVRERLDGERARGVGVIGPTPEYDPSQYADATGLRDPVAWSVVLQVRTPGGRRTVVSGTGTTPDAAARAALAAMDDLAR